MKCPLRYRIKVQEIRVDYIWVEADSWIEAESKAILSSDLCLELDPITGGRTAEWTEDVEELNKAIEGN
ncbi:MAG: hypothetical protein GY941_30495 [Planctomycetes bacterium]|nr:hypothetical protein [Planctomycetota bacterium]